MTYTRCIVGALVIAAGALGTGGCYYDFSDDRDDTPTAPPSYDSRATAPPGNASQWSGQADIFRGDLGTVRAFEGTAAEVTGSDYGTTTSMVRIDAEDTSARWWAMTQFSITGSLHHPQLAPGARLVFNSRSNRNISSDGTPALYVSVLGCSGPRRNEFTYDQNADEVTVNVSEGSSPDTRRIDFDAKFSGAGGEQHVTGSFVYDVQ